MKKLLLAVLITFSISCFGQDTTIKKIDSSELLTPIMLKAKQHAYIISFLPFRGSVSIINYINQVRKSIDTGYNAEQNIFVLVPASLVVDIYNTLGQQPERLTSNYNNEIKPLLIPQIVEYSWLLRTIQTINSRNNAETEERIKSAGVNFIMSINK